MAVTAAAKISAVAGGVSVSHSNRRYSLLTLGINAHSTVAPTPAAGIHAVSRSIARGGNGGMVTPNHVAAVSSVVRSPTSVVADMHRDAGGVATTTSPNMRPRRHHDTTDDDTTSVIDTLVLDSINIMTATASSSTPTASPTLAPLPMPSSPIPPFGSSSLSSSHTWEEKAPISSSSSLPSRIGSPLMTSRQSELLPTSSLSFLSLAAMSLTTPASPSPKAPGTPSSPLASPSLAPLPMAPATHTSSLSIRRMQRIASISPVSHIFRNYSSFASGGMAAAAAGVANDISTNGTLLSAARSIPHPEKAHKGGEDAHFMTSSIVGVADGVGGWAEHGIDPAEYSKGLMKEARAWAGLLCTSPDKDCSPKEVLGKAYDAIQKKRIIGSTTACLVSVIQKGDTLVLRSANLGDSGFLVIRGDRILYESKPQTHGFNFPRQLGAESDDRPQHADEKEMTVLPGDWVVLGTDGLFDNIFQRDVQQIVSAEVKNAPHTSLNRVQLVADAIGRRASIAAHSRSGDTPFALEAQNNGHRWEGGKLDDITVVVAQVQVPPAAPVTPSSPAATNGGANTPPAAPGGPR